LVNPWPEATLARPGADLVVTDLLVRLAERFDAGEPVVLVGAGKSSVPRAAEVAR
jgi:hypothetical protein